MLDVSEQLAAQALDDFCMTPVIADEVYGTWISPDAGVWTLGRDMLMTRDEKKGGISFHVEGDTLVWSGEDLDGKRYRLRFSEGYRQMFLFTMDTNECALALSRLTQAGSVETLVGNTNEYDPRGSFDELSTGYGFVHVAGWMYDPEMPDASSSYIVVIGNDSPTSEQFGPFTADVRHPGVDMVYGVGMRHGFSATLYTSKEGLQDVYVYTTDYPSGQLILMGHGRVNIPSSDSSVSNNQTLMAIPVNESPSVGDLDYNPYFINEITDFTSFSSFLSNGAFLYTDIYDCTKEIKAQYYYLLDFDHDGVEELLVFGEDENYAWHWEIWDKRDGWVWIIARDTIDKPGNAGHSLGIINENCIVDYSWKGVVGYDAEWVNFIYYKTDRTQYLSHFSVTTHNYNEENDSYTDTYEENSTLNGNVLSESAYEQMSQQFQSDIEFLSTENDDVRSINSETIRWLSDQEGISMSY